VPFVDPQRQFPADPDRWYGENPDDEAGRVPGQRGGEPAYTEDSGRYRFDRGYTEYVEPSYPDQPYPDPGRPYPEQRPAQPTYDDGGYDESGAGYPAGSEQSGRRPTARQRRVGQRSGLELPDGDGEMGIDPAQRYEADAQRYDAPDGQQRYRSEMLDRQALRRPDAPALTDAVLALPAIDPHPAESGRPDGGRPDVSRSESARSDAGTTYGSPLQTPTQPIAAAPTAVYLSRRPGLAVILVLVSLLAEVLLAKVLLGGEFASGGDGADVLSAVLGMAGVPLVSVGLYGLATGAATAGGPNSGRAWLRTPLAYLPVGLILIFAAAIAA
jgi:hypothetical protein